jgi:hypothetical protein
MLNIAEECLLSLMFADRIYVYLNYRLIFFLKIGTQRTLSLYHLHNYYFSL